MLLVCAKFAACVLLILFAGMRVAKYGDVIAEKTGLGGLWVGVVLLAVATSLPEFFTGISAVVLLKAPDLTIGDLFGANTFNLLNLALLDIVYRHGPLLTAASPRHTLVAGLSLIMVAFPASCLLISSFVSHPAIGWVGVYTPLIFVLYLLMVRMIFNFEKLEQVQMPSDATSTTKYETISLKRAFVYYAISAIIIIGAGTWLAFIGKELTELTGWGQSFVGSLFIGFATTLPEITVSFAALRLEAVDLCVANMLGSNLFNMMIVGVDDLFYTEGPILADVSTSHVFTALVVILMTGVVIAGLISRPQRKTPLKASWYSLALIGVFILGAYVNFVI
ncbi:MAG: sodium:calcium antiporter [Chloroflexota bacterium]|nr:sodium:calcium antiporter [Chloroflexota bacterium]